MNLLELEKKIIWLESLIIRAKQFGKKELEEKFKKIKQELADFLKNIEVEVPGEIDLNLQKAEQAAKELDEINERLSQQ